MTRTLFAGLTAAIIAAVACIAICLSFIRPARADEAPPAVRVPQRSALYELRLLRAVKARFNDTALVSQFAAQIHQESSWNPTAASKVASGLGQFTLPTATWIAEICPEIGPPDRTSADWSISATVCYMHWLLARNRGATLCDVRAFALADYNGGMKWRQLEQQLAADGGASRARWFDHVERFRAPRRSLDAWNENRDYVRRVLLVIEPAYRKAGWPGVGVCK